MTVNEPRIWKHDVFQGEDWEPLDRIFGRDGDALVEVDVTSIDINVYLVPEKTAVYSLLAQSPTLMTNPNIRVFDSLQVDGRWKPDSTGYNMRCLLEHADFVIASFTPEGGKVYRVEIKVVTPSWADIYSVHEYTVHPLWSVEE